MQSIHCTFTCSHHVHLGKHSSSKNEYTLCMYTNIAHLNSSCMPHLYMLSYACHLCTHHACHINTLHASYISNLRATYALFTHATSRPTLIMHTTYALIMVATNALVTRCAELERPQFEC